MKTNTLFILIFILCVGGVLSTGTKAKAGIWQETVDFWTGSPSEAAADAMQEQNFKGFSEKLFFKMAKQLKEFHAAVYPGLMESFGGWIRSFIFLYLVMVGYGIMTGFFKEATKQVTVSLFLAVFLYVFVLESDIYSRWLCPYISGFFMDLSGFFATKALAAGGMSGGKNAFSVFAGLDEMIARLNGATKAIEATSGMFELVRAKMWFAIFSLTIIYAFLYGAFMALMVMGFFSLHILYLVGGICIFFAAFTQTRFVFWSWLRGIFNYGLLIVFASIVMSICIFGLNASLLDLIDSAQKTREIFTEEYFFAVFWALVSVALILKVPDFAALLSGGSAGSTAGIAAGMGLVTSSIAKGVKTGMKGAGSGLKGAYGWAGQGGGAARAYSQLKGIGTSLPGGASSSGGGGGFNKADFEGMYD